jgi:DNA repair protein RecN (Recombination protein N)
MLEQLRIQNFAIIDTLELNFAPGFNVITGETGAGKSILIDAVELLLGGKADGASVRTGTDRALIEGTFMLHASAQATVGAILTREDLRGEEPLDHITLMREVRRGGRSSARVNGVTVSVELLREVGGVLVDIHGQTEHMSLLNPRSHLELLDRYANTEALCLTVATLVTQLGAVRAQIKTLLSDTAEIARRTERLRYDIEEISAAQLRDGEEAELRAERLRLSNSEQLAQLTADLAALLSGDERAEQEGAVDQLMAAAGLMSKLAALDTSLNTARDQANELAESAQDLSITLRRYSSKIEYNPSRLNAIEDRLELIRQLTKRYGGASANVAAVLLYAERAKTELDGLQNSGERLEQLRTQETHLLKQVGEQAHRLSVQRAVAGKRLGEHVVQELADLRMESTRFEVEQFQEEQSDGCYVMNRRLAFDETGIDITQFMMSANPGEPLRPLAKVASGGETARIMLALKRVLAQADHTPTLIFDEIDQGIGGRVGAVVGEKLWSLAADHQVLCVTHLAQLAGYGDRHYRVSKAANAGRTLTQISALEQPAERIDELAAMLGTVNDAGRQSAQAILADAERVKAKSN